MKGGRIERVVNEEKCGKNIEERKIAGAKIARRRIIGFFSDSVTGSLTQMAELFHKAGVFSSIEEGKMVLPAVANDTIRFVGDGSYRGIGFEELKDKIKKYCEDRDWDQYHKPKELAIGVITEASELLEHFRFKSEKEVESMFNNPEKMEHISDEMADILFFLVRLAQRYNIDL